jgi:hypothetical protein
MADAIVQLLRIYMAITDWNEKTRRSSKKCSGSGSYLKAYMAYDALRLSDLRTARAFEAAVISGMSSALRMGDEVDRRCGRLFPRGIRVLHITREPPVVSWIAGCAPRLELRTGRGTGLVVHLARWAPRRDQKSKGTRAGCPVETCMQY